MPARAIPVVAVIAAIMGGCDERASTRARAAASASAATRTVDADAPTASASVGEPWPACASSAEGACRQAGSPVAAMQAGFRRCYIAGRREDPQMRGSLRVRTQIGPQGDVTSAKAERVIGLSPEVVACVEKRVSLGLFSPPEGGSATIVIPLTFVSNDEPLDAGSGAQH